MSLSFGMAAYALAATLRPEFELPPASAPGDRYAHPELDELV